ncbi:hypothetical protein [Frigoriglobus tundricola]|uniref:Uncharacterized protein n=1 Tax=Frigoriglobus tundricola TaxID=2774151 RepID=A0A6M5YUR1_9BACT|nr:hypothetical protein [Frigoriglobus tundricola]QJW97837.1 hypothetical protein FTUN_5417 [Frigoriglobus tundricola]
MNDGSTAAPPAVADRALDFWSRFRDTFGPALVGLVGGGLTVGVVYVSVAQLLKNASMTYAAFPSEQPPWLVRDISLPPVIGVVFALIGLVAPFAMGLATAWLVRERDRWGEISAGLTTGLMGSLAAYVVGIGWAVTLAMAVVPSIADLTLLGESTRAPTEATAAPSDRLAQKYPDLKDKPADERGLVFFSKIISDQIAGSAYGIWLGVGLSLATVGVLGFCGTLAGGWLFRRGGSWKSIVWPYLELTVSTSVTAGWLIARCIDDRRPMAWFEAVCLVAVTVLVLAGVVGRWNALLRVTIAVTWVLVLSGAGFGGRMPAEVAYSAYALLGVLLARHWFYSGRRPVVAPV